MWLFLFMIFIVLGLILFFGGIFEGLYEPYFWIGILLIVLSAVSFGIDYTSPVEITRTVVQTNDYETYELNIDSDKLGYVEITKYNPTRFSAEIKKKTEYVFKGFVE